MSGAPIWRGLTCAELDRAYDNAGHVQDSAARLAAWAERSARLRAERPEGLDLSYGPRERNRIDLFRCGRAAAPLLVFIHGGYWQRNSRQVFSCLAEGPLARGFDVALPGYTLGPEASLTEIVAEIKAALAWLRREKIATGRLIVSGWSAGGHLAALACALPGVDAGLLISGIYDLEPIRHGSLNDKLGLTEEEVATLSPMRLLAQAQAPAIVVCGSGELAELQHQSCAYAEAREEAGLATAFHVLPGENHFTILDGLVSPDGALTELLVGLHATAGGPLHSCSC